MGPSTIAGHASFAVRRTKRTTPIPAEARRRREPRARAIVRGVPWLVIFVGGGLGAMLRYGFGGLVQRAIGSFFPWGTFVVNASGCLAIGILATLLEERSLLGPSWRLFLLVGVLGGYTTFSSFGLETWRLVETGDWLRAAANAGGSVALGLGAVACGVALARLAP